MIQYQIEREQSVGTKRKSIFVLLRQDSPSLEWRRLEIALIPLDTVAADYITAHYTLQSAWDAAVTLDATEMQRFEDILQARGNALESRTLAEALTYIDTASTLAQLRVALKELTKAYYDIRRDFAQYKQNHP